MKFATTLLLTAIVVTNSYADNLRTSGGESTDSNCPDACMDVYQPVTDEDGNTYSNECYMQAAKCKDKKKGFNPLEGHKRIYSKSFGASRDNDASANSEDSSNDISASGSTSDTPKSDCSNILCPAADYPVTDENGVTYRNQCEMAAVKCVSSTEDPLDEHKRIHSKEFDAGGNEG